MRISLFKSFAFALLVCFAAASAAFAANLDLSGDSITYGYGVTASQRYSTQLATALGLPEVNRGKNNDMAADQAHKATIATRVAGDKATIMVGTNDERTYGVNATKLGYYIGYLRRLAFDAVAPTRNYARTAAVSKTGPWANTQVNSFGMNTTTSGSTATAAVTGTSVYIGHIIQDHPSTQGVAEVRVDGVLVGTVSSNGAGMKTANNLTYGPAVTRFSGFSAGAHTVEVKVVSASGYYFFLDFIAGNAGQNGAKAFVSNVIRMNATGYANYGGSDANVSNYNAAIASMISHFTTDGLPVYLVNNWAAIDPAADLLPDGIHPDADGHTKLKNTFKAVIDAHP